MKSVLESIDDFLTSIEKGLIIVILICMICFMMIQVTFRFLGFGANWTEELSRYLFVWLILLGSSMGVKESAHVGTDYFVSLLPGGIQKVLRYMSSLLFLVLSVVIVYYGWQQTLSLVASRQTIVSVPIPRAVFMSGVPIGFGFATLHLLRMLATGNVELLEQEHEEGVAINEC